MAQVFISYAHPDREGARRIAQGLVEKGYTVWWDRSILAGANFEQEILKAINVAGCLIVLWSETSVKSDWVIDEAKLGKSKNILIPVLIDRVDPPLGFGQTQAEDLVGWGGDPTDRPFRRLLNSVRVKLDPEAEVDPISLISRRDSAAALRESEPKPKSGPSGTTPLPGGGPAPATAPVEEPAPEEPRPVVPEARPEPLPQPPLGPRVAPVAPEHRPEPGLRPAWSLGQWLLATKVGLTVTLAGVFLANWIETALETRVFERWGLGSEWRVYNTRAAHWIEGYLSFEFHDLTGDLGVRGYSISYFIIFPLLLCAVAYLLARRSDISPFRVFCLAIAIVYLLSLPFLVFFPVPERWADPESGAVLLSDKWSTRLIEGIRPISGLDNCFPSSHTSLTVIAVMIGYLFRLPLRNTLLMLGITVVLSTFVLGIHWLPDIAAGIGVGTLSVFLAYRLNRALAAAYG